MDKTMLFARSFVINLPFKTDRLKLFLERVPTVFGEVEVWPAVHGDSVSHPDWWTAGRGAWGCYRSHLQILEYCYQRGIENYAVFEDDAIFRPDADVDVYKYVESLPQDWQLAYLGGQLLHEIQHPPERINDHCWRPYNVNRTHAFAVSKRGYEILYKHLNSVPFQQGEHIDHHLGRLHETGRLQVFCPGKWISGQDSGPSNISGNNNSACYWIDPEQLVHREAPHRTIPCVFLESSIETAIELERRGWHRGHWQNEHHLDRGIVNAIGSLDFKGGLLGWYRAVVPEAIREGQRCVCLYHPTLSWECIKTIDIPDLVHIRASSPADAESMLNNYETSIVRSLNVSKPRRNLIYFIWPKLDNGVWEWNVSQLINRIEQFDGTRSIAVATGKGAAMLIDVQRAFDGVRVDNWLEFDNDPELGEVVAFSKLLETIQREDGYTFYGHAKGVSYDDGRTKEWTEWLYEICLDDTEYVEESLRQNPVTGPFTVIGNWKSGNLNGWYYSGAFYWFRNSDLRSKPNWLDIPQDHRWQSELYLGNHFAAEEAGVLFGQNAGHLYESKEIDRMRQWMSEWREQRRPKQAA